MFEVDTADKILPDCIVGDSDLRSLIEGSCVFTDPWDASVGWRAWQASRRLIVPAINRSGSLLDYGCANGFLLKCLMAWSSHRLEPYGIDTVRNKIRQARDSFLDRAAHFWDSPAGEIPAHFPDQFDFIYWAVWDNYDFIPQRHLDLFRGLLGRTRSGGRLILGFYDAAEKNGIRIEQLGRFGYAADGGNSNEEFSVTVTWYDAARYRCGPLPR